MVKHLPAMEKTWVWSLGWEALLEKEMATHSSTLAWKIPWTGEPGRLQSMGLQRVGHNWATSLSFTKCTAAAAKSLQSCPTLCDPIDVSPLGSPSLGFSRQEYWSWLPFLCPGDRPHPRIEPNSPACPALAGGFFTTEPPGKPYVYFKL